MPFARALALLLAFLCAVVAATDAATSSARKVSFWYAPSSYGGGDINNTLAVLSANRGAVTNVFVYCGHSIGETGLELDAATAALCLETNLLSGLKALGITPEIVINSGRSNISDYHKVWANATATVAVLVEEAQRFGVGGVSFDLEPQVGAPSSTKYDATLYAAYLTQARAALAPLGVRLTVAVAQWSPMLSQYATLAPAVDRLLDMETYSANSMEGWLHGDLFGGDYEPFIAAAGPVVGAPGLAGWNQTCAGQPCWCNTAASGKQRMDRIASDGVAEVAVFRLVQQDGAPKMPQDWWWPLLAEYMAGGNSTSAAAGASAVAVAGAGAVDVDGTTATTNSNKSNNSRKIYAAGSGQDMMSMPETIAEIVALSGRPSPHVLYLGTATYDEAAAQATQTKQFLAAGCSVAALPVAYASPTKAEMQTAFATADIVLVSGGNTLFAIDRWFKLGIPDLLRTALDSGTVLAGGSAGGIVWFDGGHSDSMDPASYKNPPGPLLNPDMTAAEMSAWAYVRVPGTGILPGLFCPHYDVTESNGVLRSEDFTGMLQRHTGEFGVAVDNWGALVIDGDSYSVVSRTGKPGSVSADGTWVANNTQGRPGAWKLTIGPDDGALVRTLAPAKGAVADLFRPAKYVAPVTMLEVARAQNPDDGKPPSAGAKRFAGVQRPRLGA